MAAIYFTAAVMLLFNLLISVLSVALWDSILNFVWMLIVFVVKLGSVLIVNLVVTYLSLNSRGRGLLLPLVLFVVGNRLLYWLWI